MSRVGSWWTALTISIVVALALLTIANRWAAAELEAETNESLFLTTAQIRAERPELLARIYPGRSETEIEALLAPPALSHHPTLAFRTRPTDHGAYRVGFENMRYTGLVTAANATTALDGSTWCFGGSTVFGLGVAGDETLPHYLDVQLDGPVVNFGASASTRRLEIEHLLLLLSKGYRPRRVVFVDGLNDMLAALASPFDAEETPARVETAYDRALSIHHGGVPWRLFLRTFPLVKWWIGSRRGSADAEIDTASDLYVIDPWRHYLGRPLQFEGRFHEIDAIAARLVRQHESALDLLGGLGRGFGFEVHTFYQPNGLVRSDQPFARDLGAYVASDLYAVSRALDQAVRGAIHDGRLAPMVDLSSARAACSICYVDAVHYAPDLNAALADRIAKAVLDSSRR